MKKLLIALLTFGSMSSFASSHYCKTIFEKDFNEKKDKLVDIKAKLNNPFSALALSVSYEVASAKFEKAKKSLLLSKSIELSQFNRIEMIEKDPDLKRDLKVSRIWKLQDINQEREKVGLPTLSKEDFDKTHPVELDIERISRFNNIDYLLGYINSKTAEKISYSEFTEFLSRNMNNDYFCQNNEPLSLGKKEIKQLVMDIKH
jgi:hypothetical protein